MNNKVIIQFINEGAKQNVELEIPISITANDLIIALNEAFNLAIDVDNIFSCYLIAEIPMFSLKFKSFSWTENKIRFLFLLISLLLILFLQLSAFPVIIGLYILMSIFQKEIAK